VSVRTLAASGLCLALASVLSAACGGKVNGGSSSGASGSASVDPTPLPPSGGTGRPGRPPPMPATAASVASEIADTYCKAFSSCCVGTGQPPIDVARCRQVVAADVEASVVADLAASPEEVAACVDTIKGRIGVCSAVDAPWWSESTPAILAPGSVMQACSPIFGFANRAPSPCTSDASCVGPAARCAIDQCVAAAPVGAACTTTPGCLDGAVCLAGTCAASPDVMEKGACTTDDECRLGLVCAKGSCLPSRDFPGLGKARFSPYRVGSDTCRAYTYL
jgi:hypothetical protein